VNETSCEKSGRSYARFFRASCLVVIPTLNDEETIGAVVKDLQGQGFENIRVIDGGSSDATVQRARSAGADTFELAQCGFGQACRHGLENLRRGTVWILFCNADGTDELEDIGLLISAAEYADLVIGSRKIFGQKTSTIIRRFGNRLVSKMIQYRWGFRFSDFGSLRLIRRDALETMDMRYHSLEWNVVMQIRALEAGLKVTEVPVRSRTRSSAVWTLRENIGSAVCVGYAVLQAAARLVFGIGPREIASSLQPMGGVAVRAVTKNT
jgi:glycosyltransferase involved in cell wall biosynthesis